MGEEKKIRKAPYANTKVPIEKTKAKLEKLLRSYGIRKIVWANFDNEEVLVFEIEKEVNGVFRRMTVQIKPPHIPISKRMGGRLVQTENRNQEWRLAFHWVKVKVEAVIWGLSTMEKEFLSEILLKLPDGRSASVGEVVLNLVGENKLNSLPFFESTKREAIEEHVIEAEAVRHD